MYTVLSNDMRDYYYIFSDDGAFNFISEGHDTESMGDDILLLYYQALTLFLCAGS